ncbi:MAG: hypothetical protein B7Z37_23735 [Verrucomicrobia bacterium 12-59-8]|nr:MAG: hypothetical protein B7Z37_23735 [Verrucomicrobia bacterium 12-59-8]
MLCGSKEGTEIDGELIAMTVMGGDGFRAKFMDDTLDFDGVKDLGGVEQGVDHGQASAGRDL